MAAPRSCYDCRAACQKILPSFQALIGHIVFHNKIFLIFFAWRGDALRLENFLKFPILVESPIRTLRLHIVLRHAELFTDGHWAVFEDSIIVRGKKKTCTLTNANKLNFCQKCLLQKLPPPVFHMPMRNAAIQKRSRKGPHFKEDDYTLSVYLSLL